MQDLVKTLSTLLADKNMMLVTAESCTGGMIGAAITARAGSSTIYERGFITYSNEAKIECLGVPKNTINEHGAVSTQTATAMASGALQNSHADIAVSVTGIAGPQSDDSNKPVGLVYIGIATRNNGATQAYEHNFTGERDEIRLQTTRTALEHVIKALKNNE